MEPSERNEAEEIMEKALFNEMISAEQLDRIVALRPDNVVILDIRTDMEHKEGIIPGAQLFPCAHNLENRQDTSIFSESFGKQFDASLFSKDSQYILICRSGPRTEIAVEVFLEQELEACELIGGVMEWKRQGYAIDSAEGAVVHKRAG
ncbi:MAG: rhodanese-like domain-containing protein [Magnetococcales bacterium]|nr:rhodanese-like domain-containing protein [Magnetococcales bacterium]